LGGLIIETERSPFQITKEIRNIYIIKCALENYHKREINFPSDKKDDLHVEGPFQLCETVFDQ
jgi:hypothetical protein